MIWTKVTELLRYNQQIENFDMYLVLGIGKHENLI